MNRSRLFQSLIWLIRENFGRRSVSRIRIPEPELMVDPAQVMAFDQAGDHLLKPIYDWQIRFLKSWVADGETVLDLGCGSARFLRHFARARPRIKYVGVELSEPMAHQAQTEVEREGLSDRIQIVRGNMTESSQFLSLKPKLVVSSFALHHLPDRSLLERCLLEMRCLWSSGACAIWMFDHGQLKYEKSEGEFPEIFMKDSPTVLKDDSRFSLRAAWAFEELRGELERIFQSPMVSKKSRIVPGYQFHFIPPAQTAPRLLRRAWLPLGIPRSLFEMLFW